MKILGLEKLSLLDYPGKLCCTIFTGGCNMRCPFCHNAPLVLRNSYDQHQIEWGEIIQFLRARVKLLDGVCISGGEPTLHKSSAAGLGDQAARFSGQTGHQRHKSQP